MRNPTRYIQWLKKDDVKFRAAYQEKTKSDEFPDGEKIQNTPLESEDGLSYMVGSSRVTDQQLTELKEDTDVFSKGDDLKTSKDVAPDGWVQKFEAE